MIRYPHHHQLDYSFCRHRLHTASHYPDDSCCYWKGQWLRFVDSSAHGIPTASTGQDHSHEPDDIKYGFEDTGDSIEQNLSPVSVHCSVSSPRLPSATVFRKVARTRSASSGRTRSSRKAAESTEFEKSIGHSDQVPPEPKPAATESHSVATDQPTTTSDPPHASPLHSPAIINPTGRETPQFVKHESIQTSPADLLATTRTRPRSAFAVVRPEVASDMPSNSIASPRTFNNSSITAHGTQNIPRTSSEDLFRANAQQHDQQRHHHVCPQNFGWNGIHSGHNPWTHCCEHQRYPLHTCHEPPWTTKKRDESSVWNRDVHKADRTTSMKKAPDRRGSTYTSLFIHIPTDDWRTLLNETLDKLNSVIRMSRGALLRDRGPSIPHRHDVTGGHTRFKHRPTWDFHGSSSDAVRWYEALCNDQLRGHFSCAHLCGTGENYSRPYGSCFHHTNLGGNYVYPMEGADVTQSEDRRCSVYDEFYDCQCQIA